MLMCRHSIDKFTLTHTSIVHTQIDHFPVKLDMSCLISVIGLGSPCKLCVQCGKFSSVVRKLSFFPTTC